MARIHYTDCSRPSLPLAARTGHSDAVGRHSGLAEPSTCSRRATDARSFRLSVRTGLLYRYRLSGGGTLLQRIRLLWCWAVSRAVLSYTSSTSMPLTSHPLFAPVPRPNSNCLAGCNPLSSFQPSACAPVPACRSGEVRRDSLVISVGQLRRSNLSESLIVSLRCRHAADTGELVVVERRRRAIRLAGPLS